MTQAERELLIMMARALAHLNDSLPYPYSDHKLGRLMDKAIKGMRKEVF